MLKTTVIGNYPKISSDKNVPNLRNALHLFDRKKISASELENVYQSTIKRVIKEQEQAGVDIITDGQIRWDDLVTPFARNMEGVQIGGLIRFFDNNIYYRRPVIKSKISLQNFSVVEQFKFAQANTSKPVKAVLPGAFTFATLSLDEYYNDIEKLTLAVAEILNREAQELQNSGASYIQIDEPSLCKNPEKVELVKRATEIIFNGIGAQKEVWLYFGKIDRLVPELFDFSVDLIGIDVVSYPENLNLILKNSFDKRLGLGCLDARNTKIEKETELLKLFEQVSKKIKTENIFVAPSCGLEFLPHEAAIEKLKHMVSVVKNFNSRFK